MANHNGGAIALPDDPMWYKDAIFYELHVRAFYDSDGDGTGDFRGLLEKLDYLQDLGVTALWLLPFYPSPRRDDGYDIADYTKVHSEYGTLRDFRAFLNEANRRGIRVITELVVNHTSDQHPWFQRARRAGPRSRYRDFYVWSNTPNKYADARTIFKDFESSNWSWDPVAKAHFWHRFYFHQPDLNYDNPQVKQAIMRVMDYWLEMGVSGLRLDAVPYLYEREGTNCENLPETHLFLKELRRHMDSKFPGRMLLAEANQWPEDAAAYFGSGDECHMNFHFPVMPRMFMGLRMEDSFPIVDILQQTPQIPENCQWAIFLRNHDELTLEMVTDEERDYMYRVYAHDAHARINLGIRRRLAPLLNNDRKKIELMNALLFSLPGTPVLYYGDEIGMGDNFYLGDRNGVRTPMQWSADRNAGFSRANPQSLYLPPIIDPEYHYEAINVEAQQKNPDSPLWWMKRTISLRKRFKAFSRGSLEFVSSDNNKVLTFVRRYDSETILVVANLSRLAQHTFLDLGRFAGRTPVELFGQTEFPRVKEGEPYFLTLGPYSFYWFALEPQRVERASDYAPPSVEHLPVLQLRASPEDLFSREVRPVLGSVFLSYMKSRRWFGGKARRIQSVEIPDVVPMQQGDSIAYMVFVQVSYTDGEPETYALPVAVAFGSEAREIVGKAPQTIVSRFQFADGAGGEEAAMFEVMADEPFQKGLLQSMARRRQFKGEVGEIHASHTRGLLRKLAGEGGAPLAPRVLRVEQSNTSIVYGDKLIFKLFRRPGEGVNPDLEIGLFLTEQTDFANIAPVAGALEYTRGRHEEPMTLGILQGYVENQGDAWKYTMDFMGRYFEWVLARHKSEAPPVPKKSLVSLAADPVPDLAQEGIGPYLESARLLGQRTGEMHVALASATDDPAFTPETFTDLYRRSLYQSLRNLTSQTFTQLRRQLRRLPEDVQKDAQWALDMESEVLNRFRTVFERRTGGMRTRVHNDYHLGQVLYTGRDFVIIDFEGEPARPLSERRIKRSPLRDVAGMIRSFHYAPHAALLGQAPTVLREEDKPILKPWGEFWYAWVSAVFLKSYLETARRSCFLPSSAEEVRVLLDAYILEKAIYEVSYELNNRPDWVSVPLAGILQLLEARS